MGITKNGSKAMKQQSGIVKEEQVSVVVEKNNVEYKTYFHCITCNTDIFKNTEAFDHLGKYFVYANWETNILIYCTVTYDMNNQYFFLLILFRKET